jgi:hypothetical protein
MTKAERHRIANELRTAVKAFEEGRGIGFDRKVDSDGKIGTVSFAVVYAEPLPVLPPPLNPLRPLRFRMSLDRTMRAIKWEHRYSGIELQEMGPALALQLGADLARVEAIASQNLRRLINEALTPALFKAIGASIFHDARRLGFDIDLEVSPIQGWPE